MLASSKRLRANEVRRVMAHGRGVRGKTLSLKILDTTDSFRCAVVISKKVAGSAVVRNRLRRVIYQALRKASLPRRGHAILFVHAVPENPLSIFTSEIKNLLHV